MIIKAKKHRNQKKEERKKKRLQKEREREKKAMIISYVLVQSQLPRIMRQDGLLVFIASSSGIMKLVLTQFVNA